MKGPHGAFGGKVREGGCCLVPEGGGGIRGQEKLTAQLVGASNVAHFNVSGWQGQGSGGVQPKVAPLVWQSGKASRLT